MRRQFFALGAWQEGLISAAHAMAITGARDVNELLDLCRKYDVGIRIKLLPEEQEELILAVELLARRLRDHQATLAKLSGREHQEALTAGIPLRVLIADPNVILSLASINALTHLDSFQRPLMMFDITSLGCYSAVNRGSVGALSQWLSQSENWAEIATPFEQYYRRGHDLGPQSVARASDQSLFDQAVDWLLSLGNISESPEATLLVVTFSPSSYRSTLLRRISRNICVLSFYPFLQFLERGGILTDSNAVFRQLADGGVGI